MKYEGKLSKFLKAHKCYDEFVKAIRVKYQQSLEEFCDKSDARYYILCGVDWDSSKKGIDFWIALNKEWKNGE